MNWHSSKSKKSLNREMTVELVDGWGDDWERDVPRVATHVKDRISRLKCLGNGWVIYCVVMTVKYNYIEIANKLLKPMEGTNE